MHLYQQVFFGRTELQFVQNDDATLFSYSRAVLSLSQTKDLVSGHIFSH